MNSTMKSDQKTIRQCNVCLETKPISFFEKGRNTCKKCRSHKWLNNKDRIQISAARAGAKKKGVEFTLTNSDLIVPKICPVLGIEIKRGKESDHNNKASIDRILPYGGYTPENSRIISRRANTLKSDGTIIERDLIIDYMRQNEFPYKDQIADLYEI